MLNLVRVDTRRKGQQYRSSQQPHNGLGARPGKSPVLRERVRPKEGHNRPDVILDACSPDGRPYSERLPASICAKSLEAGLRRFGRARPYGKAPRVACSLRRRPLTKTLGRPHQGSSFEEHVFQVAPERPRERRGWRHSSVFRLPEYRHPPFQDRALPSQHVPLASGVPVRRALAAAPGRPPCWASAPTETRQVRT